MPQDTLLSVDEFAESIKKKYPQYDKLDNKDLASRMIAKYPVYKDRVRLDSDKTPAPKPTAGPSFQLPPTPTRSARTIIPPTVHNTKGEPIAEALGAANAGLEALEAPGKKIQEKIAGLPDLDSYVSYNHPVLKTAAAGVGEAGRQTLSLAAGLVSDPKNWPFLLTGGPEVRPAIRLGADALFVALQQSGALSAVKEGRYKDAAIDQAFALLGAHGIGSELRTKLLDEAAKRDTARTEASIAKDREQYAKLSQQARDRGVTVKGERPTRPTTPEVLEGEKSAYADMSKQGKTRSAGARADETIANATEKTSTGDATLIEGKPRDAYSIMEEEAKRRIDYERKAQEEADAKAAEARPKVTDRRGLQGVVPEGGESSAPSQTAPTEPAKPGEKPPQPGLDFSKQPEPVQRSDQKPVQPVATEQPQVSETKKEEPVQKPEQKAVQETEQKKTKSGQDTVNKTTKAKPGKLPDAPERGRSPFQRLVDDAVHSHLNGVADLFEGAQTEDVGKLIGGDPKKQMNAGSEPDIRRIGGGYKDVFPFLEDFKENPKMIATAIRRGSGALYDRILKSAQEWVLHNEGNEIQEFLDLAGPDELDEIFHQKENSSTPPRQTGLLPESGNPLEFKEGEGKSALGRTEQEGFSKLAGGRRPELLKEGKQFDEQRLVNSELFQGEGGRQGKLGGGGANAATAFPSAVSTAREQVKEALRPFSAAADDIRKTFAPAKRGASAEAMGGLLRNTLADIAVRDFKIAEGVKTARTFFEKASRDERLSFIDRVETGQKQSTPELQKFADTMRSIRESLWKDVQARGGPKTWIDNYWVHMWKDPAKAESQIAKYYARRPLLGAKDFLHKREIPTVKFGMEELGLEPLFDNPVDSFLTQAHQLHKYILMKDMVEEAKDLGVLQFKSVFDTKNMAGMQRVNDPIGTVYGPPQITIKEAYDENLFQQINSFARSLGIQHYRQTQMKGGMWGYTRQGESSVFTRFAGPETVLTHEIGHQLDFRYGLADRLVKNPATRDELRALADMRFEGKEAQVSDTYKKYVRKGSEKIANLIHAVVHDPERAKAVAPQSVQALRELSMFHEELKPLFDIKPSLVLGEKSATIPVGGQLVLGHLYAPEPAARILNNYLSPGLRGSGIYDVARYTSNLLNMAQLGFSAFHLTFTAMDSAVSTAALGIQQFSRGELRKGLINVGKAVIPGAAPLENAVRGSRLLSELTKPGSQGEFYARAADSLVKGGGRPSMDAFYHDNAVQSFWDAFHAGKAITPLKAIPALIEYVSRPIMSYWVPRQKLGIFTKLAEHEMERLGDNATPTEVRTAMGRAWDSVDNRMGQMVYDNLFWNRSLKDLGLASVRSLGWNLGTFRELGGGAVDATKMLAGKGEAFRGGRFQVTPRMAYAIALPFVVGLYGSMLHYGLNGSGPKELKDAFFVPTGRQNPDGTPERISLPSYMKDVFQYSHDFPYGATQTLEHKAAPEISMIFDMLNNEDFYGTKIRNEDDPIVKQAAQVLGYVANNFAPFSLRNAQQRAEANASSVEQAESFFGILPAPKWVDRSAAEQLASKYVAAMLPRGSRTQVEADRSKLRASLLRDFQQKKDGAAQKLQQSIRDGRLHPSDESTIMKDLRLTYLQRLVERIGLVDALNVWDKASDRERNEIRQTVIKKASLIRNMPADMQPELQRRIQEIVNSRGAGAVLLPPVPFRTTGARP